MTVVSPINVMSDVVVDYTVTTSADENLPEYNAAKTDYILEDEVKVLADKKKYKLADNTVDAGVIPKDNPTIWIESPLIEFAMFNYNNEYASSFDGNYKCTIQNANIMDTLYFQDIDGDTVTVELLDASNVVLDTLVEDIYDWDINSFGKYIFPDEPTLKRKIQIDFFHIDLNSLRITISGTTTKCRYCTAGYKDDLGITLRDGIGYNQNNFFAPTRDSWGNLIDTEQRVIEDVSLPVINYNTDIDTSVNKISRLFASPHLFIADDRDKANVEFPFINIFGVFVSSNTVPGSMVSHQTLKIQGK